MGSRETTPQPADLQKWQEELDTPLENDVLDDFGAQSKYDFRIAARQTQTASFTWVDQDQSGNYDPAEERRRALVVPIIKRKRAILEHVDEEAPKRPRISTWQQGRTNGQQLTVKLSVTTETGKACLRAFGTALDNWPPPQSCASMSVETPDHCSDAMDTSFNDFRSFGERPYQFRNRDRCDLRKISTYNGCDPPDLSSITLGKPEARGCKACLALHVRCPLLDEGSRYPCDECKDADVDCELVVEPVEKRKCEGCLKKKIACSYQEGSDPSWPCRNCLRCGFKCVAGPKSGRTRTGPSLDQGLVPVKTPKRSTHKSRNSLRGCQANAPEEISGKTPPKARSTTQCCDRCSVARKRWCSLNKDDSKAGCDYCKENGLPCAPESAYHRELRIARREERNATVVQEKLPQRACEGFKSPMGDRTIVTKLAHPISFNHLNAEGDGVIDCHWCEDLYYGLQGLGKTEMKVKDLGDALGYLEVGNGFTAAGFLPSRMCHGCTTERMSILVCKGHVIETIQGSDPDSFDHESYLNWLEPGKASLAPFTWCSICPTPALYMCGTFDESVIEPEDADSLGRKGCGLNLCESCAVMLVGHYNSNLEGLIDKLGKDMENTEGIFELRADADFLHPRGELARRWPYLTDD